MDQINNIKTLWSLVDKRKDDDLDSFLRHHYDNTRYNFNTQFKTTLMSIMYFRNISTSDMKNCLLTMIYLSHFEREGSLFLKVGPEDIDENLPRTQLYDLKHKDGRERLFWKVAKCGEGISGKIDCQIEKVQILSKYQKVARRLLLRIVNNTKEGTLADGTPIVNLIILAGKKFQQDNFSVDLLDRFWNQISQNQRVKAHVKILCPYSNESMIDVLLRDKDSRDLHIDLLRFSELGAKPNRMTTTYWKIMEEIRSNDPNVYYPSFKIPEPKHKGNLGESFYNIEQEVTIMTNTNDDDYKQRVNNSYVSHWKYGEAEEIESKITENVVIWLIEAMKNCPPEYQSLADICEPKLSGSMAEGCRLKTRQEDSPDKHGAVEYEMDIIVAAKLDIHPVLTDQDRVGGFM